MRSNQAAKAVRKKDDIDIMKYKLAIFDLDGTILDTLEDLADSTNYALSVYHMPEHTIDEVRWFVGNGIHKLIERAVPKGSMSRLSRYLLHLKNITKTIVQ